MKNFYRVILAGDGVSRFWIGDYTSRIYARRMARKYLADKIDGCSTRILENNSLWLDEYVRESGKTKKIYTF